MRLGRTISAGAGSAIISVMGLFVGVSPWLGGLNDGRQPWSLATKTDFWSGLSLVVVGLGTILLYRASLGRDLAALGIISRKPTLEEEVPASEASSETAPGPLSDEALLALAQSVVNDMANEKSAESEGASAESRALTSLDTDPVSEEELIRLASSLLHEIQTTNPPVEDSAGSQTSEREKPASLSEAELVRMAEDLLQEIQQSRVSEVVGVKGDGYRG